MCLIIIMNTNFIEERILLIKIRSGRVDLFVHVYDKYAEVIYRYLSYKLPSKEVVEDITSEVFTRTLEYLTNSERQLINQLKPFLYKLAKAAVADYYRANKANELRQVDAFNENTYTIQPEVNKNIELSALQKALWQLPNDQREAVMLKYIEGLSAGEIGDIMEKSTGAVRVLIHRGIEKLRAIMGSPHTF